MAAPDQVTMKDLSGTWVMSQSLSDPLDPSLKLQGIPWLIRRVVSWATITGRLKQAADENGTTFISIEQTATGGIKGETETHRLDWSPVTHGSAMFGSQTVRSRWIDLKDNPKSENGTTLDHFLTEGWLDRESPHVQVSIQSEKGWTAEQIWGFATVQEKRYHVRKFLVRNNGEVAKAQMVYEWLERQ
ncbi:hypothetical protein BGW36DRAFT_307634 [Talaromyces proteolyticus]|uniref:Lipocalin-like domain-containing protein n=1 Tax=Talaromyces proteolyticus TaxID=1131652 RepID=A0AAD4PUV4_9EURO|nr:uncharacterized protein BGW36DRAFT_307634 [Talaromyces proteolyticus]KAH8689833.1 hypothetical protein BGW36DRAFT_307634 [Talaromyces proteolyticus]